MRMTRLINWKAAVVVLVGLVVAALILRAQGDPGAAGAQEASGTPAPTETPAPGGPTLLPTATATPVQKLPGGPERKFEASGCVFRIQLLGVLENKDSTVTWEYKLVPSPVSGCGLSHWVLSLCQPDAFDSYIDSEPDPSGLTVDGQGNPRPDRTTGLTGVKWDDIPDRFTGGTFSVTLGENLPIDPDVEFAIKAGFAVVPGTIEGPNCQPPTPTPSPTPTSTPLPVGFLDIVAGTGVETGSIDGPGGDPADDPENSFKDPAGLDTGSLYVADQGNNRVVLVQTDGTLLTVAGTGTPGYSGDSGPATSAELNQPWGVDLGPDGALYIGDTANHVVRKVVPGADGVFDGDPDEIITTVAGTGVPGYSGDFGPAKSAKLNSPHGVVADAAGGLFIADTGNDVIRKVHSDGNITTYAGGGQGCMEPCRAIHQSLSEPIGVDVDSLGFLFIGEAGSHRIRRVDSPALVGFFYNIKTVAGTGTPGYSGDEGPATEAQVNSPRGVAVDAMGRLFFADTGNGAIRKVEPGSDRAVDGDPDDIMFTVAGGGAGCEPPCLATDYSFVSLQDVAIGSTFGTEEDDVVQVITQSAGGSGGGGGGAVNCGASSDDLADPYLMAMPLVGLLLLQFRRRRQRP